MTLRAKSILMIVGFIVVCGLAFSMTIGLSTGVLGAPLSDVQAWFLAVAVVVVAALAALVWMRYLFLAPLRRLARTMEVQRGSAELAGTLAGWADDELGHVAHESAFLLRQFQSARQQNQQITADLQHAQGRVRAVFDTLPWPIMLVDEQGRINQFNRRAGRLLGWRPHDALREPLHTIIPDPFDPGQRNSEEVFRESRAPLIAQARESGKPPLVHCRSARGELIPLRLQIEEISWHSRRDYLFLFEPDKSQLEGYVVEHLDTVAPALVNNEQTSAQAPSQGREVYDEVRKLLQSFPQIDTLESVDVSVLVEQVASSLGYELKDTEGKIRLLQPTHAFARASGPSLRFVLGEALGHVLGIAREDGTVNIMVTDTADAVGVLIETAVDATLPGGAKSGTVRLNLAEEMLKAMQGTLSLYTDIPGSVQVVVELPRATQGEKPASV